MKTFIRCAILLAATAISAFCQPRPAQAGSFVSGYLANRPVLCDPVSIYYATDVPDLTICTSRNTWASMAAGMIATVNANNAATATLATTATTALSANTVAPAGPVPLWQKYSLVSIANGVNTCASVNGCWQVNGVYNSARSHALTQDVVLFQLPAGGFVSSVSIKTAVACTGTTTALAGLGTAGSNALFRARTYDIKAAVTATNFSDATPTAGRNTTAAENVVASLITTAGAELVDTLAAACAVDFWVRSAVLP